MGLISILAAIKGDLFSGNFNAAKFVQQFFADDVEGIKSERIKK